MRNSLGAPRLNGPPTTKSMSAPEWSGEHGDSLLDVRADQSIRQGRMPPPFAKVVGRVSLDSASFRESER